MRGLTAREYEVAVAVGRGLTNRQIAAGLHVAERTAQNHVQHVLTKLGFTTRSQIATWITEITTRTDPSS
ncbi:response regulator transcription factor [Kibdelosporangium lantanae]|uniref:Response regulator transcription factor n=1 Tax=Kibdelosporangium lantanae TaxID=1497396 RepID=A0ABW3M595_9PSEU